MVNCMRISLLLSACMFGQLVIINYDVDYLALVEFDDLCGECQYWGVTDDNIIGIELRCRLFKYVRL